MKRLLIFVLTLCAMLEIATAVALSDEQKEVQAFIKKLYAVDSLTFEFGELNKKFDPKKVNQEVYPKFFTRNFFDSAKNVQSLEGFIWMRHPSMGQEDLSQISGVNLTKNPKLLPPVVNGNKGYADVYSNGSGRTLYFLTKTPDGWRINNSAAYTVWPRNDGTCWEPIYLVTPTPEQQAFETKECIKYRQSQAGKK